jgi:PIN domain nuclease of toxin-antitoxin system
MHTQVLDAYALLAFFLDEPGADTVQKVLLDAQAGRKALAMSVVNLGEVWYAIARAVSPATADQYIQRIYAMSIDILDADWEVTRQASVFKVRGKISYADCFAAALAKVLGADVLTGDKEFKVLEGEIGITWL